MESVGRRWQRNEDCCGPRSFLDCVRLADLEFRGRRGSTGIFFVFLCVLTTWFFLSRAIALLFSFRCVS